MNTSRSRKRSRHEHEAHQQKLIEDVKRLPQGRSRQKWALGGRVLTQFSPVLGVVCRKEVAVRDLSNAGAACLSKPFAFAHLSGLVQAPACERLLRAFIKKGGITLVHTSSTSSAPQLAAVLLQLLAACNGHCASWLLALAACVL